MTRVSIFLFFLMILIGCKENFFDSVVELDVPTHVPQLTVSAHFNDLVSDIYIVGVSHSLGILDSAEISILTDATVELYENNDLMETLTLELDRNNRPRWYQGQKKTFQPNALYTLKVESPTYGMVEATQTVPTKVEIIEATYNERKTVDRNGDRGEEVSITFQDPPGEKNYYRAYITFGGKLFLEDTTIVSDNFYIRNTPVDPIINEYSYMLLFTDASFNGEKYTITLASFLEDPRYTNIDIIEAERINFYLISVSQDYYSYWRSLQSYRDNKNNIFAEPTNVYENVEGGIGIFTIGTGDVFTIEL